MHFRRGLAAIVVATATLGAAIALTAACSLTTSTDGLSGGALLHLDATTDSAPSDGSIADRASVPDGADAEGGDAAPHTFPPEAQTWSGNAHGYAVYVVPNGLTWIEARDRAVQGGGHLATLGSAEENGFVLTMLNDRSDAFNSVAVGPWLGGFQDNPAPADEPAGKWRWVDDTPWSFTFWTTGQPDNSGNIESYLDVYVPSGVVGWNDDALGGNGGAPVISYVVEYE